MREAAPHPEPKEQPETSVGLVLDPEYGERLGTLIEHMPVWAINSTTNRTTAEWLWEKDPGTRRRITLFDVPQWPLNTQEFVAAVASIDLQRAQHSLRPLRDLEVIGMEIFPDLNGALLEFGFERVETTVSGFKATGLKRS